MALQKLILEQFRNYHHLELDFDPTKPVTFIIGENGQGKTNILEAIYLLALTKSFRSVKSPDMIQWDQEYARVQGRFSQNDQTFDLEFFAGNPPNPAKVFKKNGIKIMSADAVGSFKIVFFHPEDLNILYLGPDLRRRYLDILNIQTNKKYFKVLSAYQRILKQRNALLHLIRENHVPKSELEIWDQQLVDYGSIIIFERSKTLEYLKRNLEKFYQEISENQEKIDMNYKHSLKELFEQSTAEWKLDSVRTAYKKALEEAQFHDIRAAVTTIGPHRDDFEISLNYKKLHLHASRGEYRSMLLALKLLELQFLEEKTGQKPLLLFDDVFSELDPKRQSMLLKAVQDHQAIITSAEEHAGIAKIIQTNGFSSQYLKVADGEVLN